MQLNFISSIFPCASGDARALCISILIVFACDPSRCRISSAVCAAKFHHPPETKHKQVVATATEACVGLLLRIAGKTGKGW